MWQDVSASKKNPLFRPNTLFKNEEWKAPRCAALRRTYPLEALVQGEADEFGRILRLRHWVHQQILPDPARPAVDGEDVLRILEDGPRGGQYHCAHHSKALNAVLNAMGYVARYIFAGAGQKEEPLSGAHGADEVWSNARCKWILVDSEHDFHFEKDGVPLSALEVRDEVWRDGAAQVTRIQGPERKPLPKEPDDSYGRTARTYAFVSFYADGNRHTIYPRPIDSHELVLDDANLRGHTWYRGGEKHWAYAAGHFRPVADRAQLEWTPNVLEVKTTIRGEVAGVRLASCTPNFQEYQKRRADGRWERVEEAFDIPLRGERVERRLRARNQAGVAGPEYRLAFARRPEKKGR